MGLEQHFFLTLECWLEGFVQFPALFVVHSGASAHQKSLSALHYMMGL